MCTAASEYNDFLYLVVLCTQDFDRPCTWSTACHYTFQWDVCFNMIKNHKLSWMQVYNTILQCLMCLKNGDCRLQPQTMISIQLFVLCVYSICMCQVKIKSLVIINNIIINLHHQPQWQHVQLRSNIHIMHSAQPTTSQDHLQLSPTVVFKYQNKKSLGIKIFVWCYLNN